jgi:hypothetical protein
MVNELILNIVSAIFGGVIGGIIIEIWRAFRTPYPTSKIDYWIRKTFKIKNLRGKEIKFIKNFKIEEPISVEDFKTFIESKIKEFRNKIQHEINLENNFLPVGPINYKATFKSKIETFEYGEIEIDNNTNEAGEIDGFVISIKISGWAFKNTDSIILLLHYLIGNSGGIFKSEKITVDDKYTIYIEVNREPVIYTYISKLGSGHLNIKSDGMIISINNKEIAFTLPYFIEDINEKIKEALIWYI